MPGVKRIRIEDSKDFKVAWGSLEDPLHVIIGSKEDDHRLIAYVGENDYYSDTPKTKIGKERWIWRIVDSGGLNFTKNDARNIIGNRISCVISKRKCGSAVAWLEAFHNEPENKLPAGFYVSGKCEQKIVSSEWRYYQNDNNGPALKETEELSFNAPLQLHIDTEGLNGDMLTTDLFIDDELLDSKTEMTYGGKLIINVTIARRWYFIITKLKGQNWKKQEIKVCLSYGPDMKQQVYIQSLFVVNNHKIHPISKHSVVPVYVGKVEVSPRKYEPCKFTAIYVTIDEDEKDPYFIENSSHKEKTYQLTAGSDKGSKQVTIELSEYTNIGCKLNDDSHTKQEFELITRQGDKIETSYIKVKEKNEITFSLTSGVKNFAHMPMKYFWLPDLYREYEVKLRTCRYDKNILFQVYPDIAWELKFFMNLSNPLAYKTKGLKGHSFEKAKKQPKN